jgi:aminobenzoyl-glutamate utilization protein B
MKRLALILLLLATAAAAQTRPPLDALKREAAAEVEKLHIFTQQMVDQVFSYSELGFQEHNTSRYLTDVLEKHGFQVERGAGGMPTAWIASWGTGKPVIGFISDIDAVPYSSQKPGVAYHAPLIEGGPGHGEGHNSGVPLNITAAIVLKQMMEKHKIPGTLRLYPGVAEELVATKAFFVRDGWFKDVDIMLGAHVDDMFGISYGQTWGDRMSTGLVSIEYHFKGRTAHSAFTPWAGKSALDAVELMNIGWNYRREHLHPQQRSHYVITQGGDQPNVVPAEAKVWYYFRQLDYPRIKEMVDIGNTIAEAAAKMTDTTVTRRILGSAWPPHFNKIVAEAAHKNITTVGMPQWSEADQTLAKALQKEIGVKTDGLKTQVAELEVPREGTAGGSDDIGDISWTLPTVYLRYPSNIPNLPGHHWSEAVAMATPIAHKGVTAGAKVQAMTALDFLLSAELREQAWAYFREQTKDVQYVPFIAPSDQPALELNKEKMEKFGPELKKLHFDPTRYKTYLEQLGIAYPTVKK